MRPLWLLVALLSLLACSSDDDSGGAGKPAPRLVFEADATPSGTAVTLRPKELGQDRLVLELVGHSLSELYGVAFRLRYDPSALAFQKLDASPLPVVLGSAATPGLLVGTVTAKGKAAGLSGSEVVLGVVTFALTEQKPGDLDFVAERSALVGTDGQRVLAVSWAGGQLVKK